MEYILFAVFLPVWLVLMFVGVRYAIPGEPSGASRGGLALVIVGANLLLAGFLGYHGYLLLSQDALLVQSSAVSKALFITQQILALAALACVGVGEWMRIRATLRARRR